MKGWLQNAFIVLVIVGLAGLSMEMVSFRYWVTARQEVDNLFSSVREQEAGTIQNHQLAGLPGSVQTWLQQSNIVGRPGSLSARTRQEFSIRTGESARWYNGLIHYYVNTVVPGFVWMSTSKEIPFVRLSGKSLLLPAHEEETHPLLSMGRAQILQGMELRKKMMVMFLADLAWIPAASVKSYLDWEGLPENKARVSLTMDGIMVQGVYTYGNDGFPESFTGEIPVFKDGSYVLRSLKVSYDEYISMSGIMIPRQMEYLWTEAGEETAWLSVVHTELDYNAVSLLRSF